MTSEWGASHAGMVRSLGDLRLSVARGPACGLSQVRQLRREVWSAEPSAPPELARSWPDGLDAYDDDAIHFWVWERRLLVAAARLTLHERFADVPDRGLYPAELELNGGPVASLNRLVVAPTHRGLGIAHVLDEARCRWSIRVGAEAIIVAVGQGRERRLEGLGFAPTAFFETAFVSRTGSCVAKPVVLLVRARS